MALIDFDKYMVMGCVPIEQLPQPPPDQNKCEAEPCPLCKKPMWVSEFKRYWIKQHECRRMYCFVCIINDQLAQGLDPRDLGIVNTRKMV